MPNHYHLLVESVHGNLSQAMKMIGQEFTQGKNRPAGKDGPTFKGRFVSKPVFDDAHWFHLPFYIHLNPVEARLVMKPSKWDWSSRQCFSRKDGKNSFPFVDNANELAKYGQTTGYRTLERKIVCGERREPTKFDTVLFGRGARYSPVVLPDDNDNDARSRDLSKALQEVIVVTGCTKISLTKTIMGPQGNLPRALAVWWLAYGYHATNVEISKVLKMSDSAAAKTLARFKGKGPRYQNPQLWNWVDQLKINGK